MRFSVICVYAIFLFLHLCSAHHHKSRHHEEHTQNVTEDKSKDVEDYKYAASTKPEEKAIRVGIWSGGPGFLTQSLRPETLIVFNSERYGNWSDWSECIAKDCIEVRHRKCLDDSWKTPSPNRIHTTRCLSKYYAEKRTCRNETQCSSYIGAQLVESLTEMCGIRSEKPKLSMKITGGKVTEPHSWPWVVRLSIKPPGGKPISFCGGTLVAPQWILTAAHCLLVETKNMPVGKPVKLADHMKSVIFAHLGDHHQFKREKYQQDYRVTMAILHPRYHRSLMTDGDDIALLHLSEPVNINEAVGYVCLPQKSLELEPGTKCYALGWGKTAAGKPPTFDNLQGLFDSLFMPFPSMFSHPFNNLFGFDGYRSRRARRDRRTGTPTELHEVELPIVSLEECRKHYGDVNTDLHLCAGEKGKDTCGGDSGGGLYCHDPKSDRWTVVGVTSFGLARGCGLNPGVYTSVSAHMDWISKQMAEPATV